MKYSESIQNLAAALVAAQTEMRGVAKDVSNPEFRSKYASLDAIVAQVRPLLAKHGLAIVQGATTPHSDETGRIAAIAVETMLVHASGEWLINTAIMPVVGRMLKGGGRADPDPQAGGSALTYGRRYGLSALLSLCTDEDDDGNGASGAKGRSTGVSTQERRTSAPSGSSGTVSGPAPASPSLSANKRMPMGKHKGKELGEIPTEDLVSTVKWCREKGKFDDLVEACNEVLELRNEQLATAI